MILRLCIFADHIELYYKYNDVNECITDIENACKHTGCNFDKDTGYITGQQAELFDFIYWISGWYDCLID